VATADPVSYSGDWPELPCAESCAPGPAVRRRHVGRGDLHRDAPVSAQLADRFSGVGQWLAVSALLVLDGADAPALVRPGDDGRGLIFAVASLGIGGFNRGDVVAVNLDRAPAERPGPAGVGGGVPAVPGLAALAEPVDIQDGGQVAELS
jgi:hypothetical protein